MYRYIATTLLIGLGTNLCIFVLSLSPCTSEQDQDDAYALFQYGPEVGDRRYRESVAKFLTEEYRSPVNV